VEAYDILMVDTPGDDSPVGQDFLDKSHRNNGGEEWKLDSEGSLCLLSQRVLQNRRNTQSSKLLVQNNKANSPGLNRSYRV